MFDSYAVCQLVERCRHDRGFVPVWDFASVPPEVLWASFFVPWYMRCEFEVQECNQMQYKVG